VYKNIYPARLIRYVKKILSLMLEIDILFTISSYFIIRIDIACRLLVEPIPSIGRILCCDTRGHTFPFHVAAIPDTSTVLSGFGGNNLIVILWIWQIKLQFHPKLPDFECEIAYFRYLTAENICNM
jgi:hypothetical protein